MGATTGKLDIYAQPTISHRRGGALSGSLGISLLLFGGLGLLLVAIDPPPLVRQARQVSHRIAFHAPEPVVVPEPEPVVEPIVPELMPETSIAQPVDRPAPEPVIEQPVVAALEPASVAPAPRRVYGVRKVMARGLGQGGGAASAGLVTKRGNVLDGVADTLTATAADLQGELAALSSVERAPEPVHQVKPRYSEALVAARASGVVTARLLVDVDGTVARVEVLEDLGHDSAQLAADALSHFRFRPALRHGEPVPVWIVYRMRFEFQE